MISSRAAPVQRCSLTLNAAKSAPAGSDDTHDPESQEQVSESDLSGRHNPSLFGKLKSLRLEIAKAEDVSPLAVFPDRNQSGRTLSPLDSKAGCTGRTLCRFLRK